MAGRRAFLASAVGIAAAWCAGSPQSRRVVVKGGVQLHLLDWGGTGDLLLLIPGLGDTAYIYGDIAPAFTDRFHVVGMTPRGFGQSDQPESGYELDSLVEDIRAVLDSLGAKKAGLAGHSFGGVQLTRFAELHADRVSKLIYFDTAYVPIPPALTQIEAVFMDGLAKMARRDSFSSWNARRTYEQRIRYNAWSPAAEANLRECYVEVDGRLRARTPGSVFQAIFRDNLAGKWDLTRIQQPALMIFAINPLADHIPDLAPLAEDQLELIKEASIETERLRRTQIEAFRANGPHVRIVEMPRTDHRCFIHKREETLRHVNSFLS